MDWTKTTQPRNATVQQPRYQYYVFLTYHLERVVLLRLLLLVLLWSSSDWFGCCGPLIFPFPSHWSSSFIYLLAIQSAGLSVTTLSVLLFHLLRLQWINHGLSDGRRSSRTSLKCECDQKAKTLHQLTILGRRSF